MRNPLPPSALPGGLPAARAARRAALALLAALVAASVGAAQPPKDKEPEKKEAKDPEKKDEKKEVKWPTEINGKSLTDVVRDLSSEDPTIREFAARMLPGFGPPAQKDPVSKALLKHMTAEETDPGVRFAVWEAIGSIAFDSKADNEEALRRLADVVDRAQSGSASRYQAVKTISMFGPKGAPAITALTGVALKDYAYETRRQIATALGRAGANDVSGPNMKALTTLADVLAKDPSAAVRMEALQGLLLLGPPWAELKKPGAKENPPTNEKSAAVVIAYMRARVGDPKAKTPGTERDRQCEIWARLVLMRFDPKEINEDNLEAFARHLSTPDAGVRVQALNAIAMMGETGARKLDAVVRILWEKEQPLELTAATVQVLEAMGGGAKPALPELKKFVESTRDDAKKIAGKKAPADLTSDELQRMKNGEELAKMVEKAIGHIEKAKIMNPIIEMPPKK